jgi:hypothetical protein
MSSGIMRLGLLLSKGKRGGIRFASFFDPFEDTAMYIDLIQSGIVGMDILLVLYNAHSGVCVRQSPIVT